MPFFRKTLLHKLTVAGDPRHAKTLINCAVFKKARQQHRSSVRISNSGIFQPSPWISNVGANMLIFTSLSWINNFEARNIFSKYLQFRSTAATHIDFTLISRLLITIHTKVTFIIFFKAVKFLTITRRIVKFTLNLSALSDQLISFHCFYGQSIPKYFLLAFNLSFSFFLNSPELIFSTPNDRNKFPRAPMRNEKNLTYTRRCAFVSALKWTKKIIQFFIIIRVSSVTTTGRQRRDQTERK